MKTIKFYEITDKISHLECDDKTDFRLFHDNYFRWTKLNELDYNNLAELLSSYSIKGKGYEIYLSHDISGFNYWVKNMQESNYICITISFDSEDFDLTEIKTLESDINSTVKYCENIEDNCMSDVIKLEKYN